MLRVLQRAARYYDMALVAAMEIADPATTNDVRIALKAQMDELGRAIQRYVDLARDAGELDA